MREGLPAAIPGTVEALTHFPVVLSRILQRRKILLISEYIWIGIKVRRLIRPKMINMIINRLLPKNMCIKWKWDKFKTFLIIYTLSWNKKLQCDHGLLSSYRSLHLVLLPMSSHNHECKRLYVTTNCIKIVMM